MSTGPEIEDEDVERLAEQRRLAAGYRTAARRALAFARAYRREEGLGGGERERACVTQALSWRAAARNAKAGRAPEARPGLARTRPGGEAPGSSRKTG